jgi:hypothetical protein
MPNTKSKLCLLVLFALHCFQQWNVDYTGYIYFTYTKMSYSNTDQGNLLIFTDIILLEWVGGMEQI